MAGYGQEIEAAASDDDIVRILVRAAQRRGKRLGLEVHYRRRTIPEDRSAWALEVQGSGVMIAAWVQKLERDLPVVAEGFTGQGSGVRAVRIGHSIPARFIELLVGDGLRERSAAVVTSRTDEARVFWPILDPPDLGQYLADRLQLADGLIGRWMVGDLPTEIGLEELHTALEIVLRAVLDAGNNTPFPTLVSRAQGDGLIDDADHVAVTRLNDHRRTVKHHGGVIPMSDEDDVKRDLWHSIKALDSLQGHLGKSKQPHRVLH